jgi:hypothetical protein
MSYQRLLDKLRVDERRRRRARPLFPSAVWKEVRRRDQLEPLAELNAWIEKSVRLDPHTDCTVRFGMMRASVSVSRRSRQSL